jgi:hypothetical protein
LGGPDEIGELFPVQRAARIRVFCTTWREASHGHKPRASVSRSIFTPVDDRDRAYAGRVRERIKAGFIDERTCAIFGRSYAAEPDILVKQLKKVEAIADVIRRGEMTP